jgi:hypothetical protein
MTILIFRYDAPAGRIRSHDAYLSAADCVNHYQDTPLAAPPNNARPGLAVALVDLARLGRRVRDSALGFERLYVVSLDLGEVSRVPLEVYRSTTSGNRTLPLVLRRALCSP